MRAWLPLLVALLGCEGAKKPFTCSSYDDDGKYDAKVDVWGLGITAIELAQMGPPFAETKQIFKVMMAIVNGPPPTLPESHAASPLFRDFLAAALVKDAADRPSCARPPMPAGWTSGQRPKRQTSHAFKASLGCVCIH